MLPPHYEWENDAAQEIFGILNTSRTRTLLYATHVCHTICKKNHNQTSTVAGHTHTGSLVRTSTHTHVLACRTSVIDGERGTAP
jgi:hypothetical protein